VNTLRITKREKVEENAFSSYQLDIVAEFLYFMLFNWKITS